MSRHRKSHQKSKPVGSFQGRQCQHAHQGLCKACTLGPKFIQRFETRNNRDGVRQYQPIAV